MKFLNIPNLKKIELFKKKLVLIEEDLFIKILEAGLDPDDFTIESFQNSFLFIEKESEDQHKYLLYNTINEILEFFIKIQNNIIALEKEENGI